MKSVERAALRSAITRYTHAKKASKAVALAALVEEGTHTKAGEITAEYGGERSKRAASGA